MTQVFGILLNFLVIYAQAKTQRVEFVMISPVPPTIQIVWDGKYAEVIEQDSKGKLQEVLKMKGALLEPAKSFKANDVEVPVKKNGTFELLLPYAKSFELVLYLKGTDSKQKTDVITVAVMVTKDGGQQVIATVPPPSAPHEKSGGTHFQGNLCLSSPYLRASDLTNSSTGYLASTIALGLGLQAELWQSPKYFYLGRLGILRSSIKDTDGKANNNQNALLINFRVGGGIRIPGFSKWTGRAEFGAEDVLLPYGISSTAIEMHKLMAPIISVGFEFEDELTPAFGLNASFNFGIYFSRESTPFLFKDGNRLSISAKLTQGGGAYHYALGPYYIRRVIGADIVHLTTDELGLRLEVSQLK